MQFTSNFSEKLKFTEVYVLFQNIFFDMNRKRRSRLPKQKSQRRVKKSKTTLVLEIRSLHQRAC